MSIPNNEHLKTLSHIRSMMESSSRFISLSGLSGVAAGIFALLGASAAYCYLRFDFFTSAYYKQGVINGSINVDFVTFFLIDALSVLILAVIFGFVFTQRNAKRKELPIWTKSTKLLILNLLIPLIAGGLFCLILVYHHLIFLVAPATLLFYGLALLNASKYTLKEVRYLGITEILLGLIASILVGYGLIFWTIGFGFLHIIYGIVMFYKYEKNIETS